MSISLCIATYNRLPHLKQLIDSILKGFENYPYEVIVVDGGSNDGTLEYLKDFDKFKIIKQKSLTGAVKAFNTCFKTAEHDYIFPLSDDVIVIPDVIEKSCRMMDKEEQIGLVAPKIEEPLYGNLSGITLRINPYLTLLPKTFIFKASVLKEINYFDESFRTYFIDDDSPLSVMKLGYTIIFTRDFGVVHYRIKDEKNNIAREVSIDKKIDQNESKYFNEKWKPLEEKLEEYKKFKPRFFKNIYSLMIYSEWLRPIIKINNNLSNKLCDWLLEQTIVFKDKQFDHLKDFYLAQKFPEEIISSLK